MVPHNIRGWGRKLLGTSTTRMERPKALGKNGEKTTDMPSASHQQLRGIMRERIMIMDGAMGTMIQRCGFGQEDFHGDRLPTTDRT